VFLNNYLFLFINAEYIVVLKYYNNNNFLFLKKNINIINIIICYNIYCIYYIYIFYNKNKIYKIFKNLSNNIKISIFLFILIHFIF